MIKNYYINEDLISDLKIDENTELNFYTKNSDLKININVESGVKLVCHIISLLTQPVNYEININHDHDSESDIRLKIITKENGKLNAIINDAVDSHIKGVVINQQSKILAVNQVKSMVKPNLLINSIDAMASHGVSIGNINSDSLYYLMTKGLTREQARIKLIQGFILGPVYDKETYDFFVKEI